MEPFGKAPIVQRVDTRQFGQFLLRHAVQSMGIDPSQAIMIGDRSFDMVGARSNGMTAVGVLYGYGSEAELREAGAHHVCATPKEVLEHTG